MSRPVNKPVVQFTLVYEYKEGSIVQDAIKRSRMLKRKKAAERAFRRWVVYCKWLAIKHVLKRRRL